MATGQDTTGGIPYPIVLSKTNNEFKAVAMEDIPEGHLVIPVFCMRESSFLYDPTATRTHDDVVGRVMWEEQGWNGMRADGREHGRGQIVKEIYCQPERRQPKAKDKQKAVDYDKNCDCHPFWHIRRSDKVGEHNSAVVEVKVTMINTATQKECATEGNNPSSAVSNFTVGVPCIKNEVDIKAGSEIVLYCGTKPSTKPGTAKRKVMNAFDQEQSMIKKLK